MPSNSVIYVYWREDNRSAGYDVLTLRAFTCPEYKPLFRLSLN